MRNSVCFLFLLAMPVVAEEKSPPAALTPKEIADGWIMLFDGESTFGWTVEGVCSVSDGMLVAGGEKEAVLTQKSRFLSGELRVDFSGDGKTWFTSTWSQSKGRFSGFSDVVGASPVLIKGGLHSPFSLVVGAGRKALIRSVKLRPIEMTSLFNGKDLTGWKVFPGAKDRKVASKFTVTPEGWLNVKDGPGDLQTEGQWADFVAQFDCISNGNHLNSGLFFRCLPDQYQQGYESQIRNEWTGDDRTKPVDFGTGAIYRRQPARKVVSTDKEWFTMTVAAHGRNIATWVNGYPVVSWADDRKESDNARQGFKAGKGGAEHPGT